MEPTVRVYLVDEHGTYIAFEGSSVSVEEGVLTVRKDGNIVGQVAQGEWRYWNWASTVKKRGVE